MFSPATFLFIISAIIHSISAETVVKFKDNHDTQYFYSLKRTAETPFKSTSEHCSSVVHLQEHKPNEKIIAQLKIIDQVFSQTEKSALTPLQLQQSETPFVVKVNKDGDVDWLRTETDETHRALSVKNQVVQTLFLNWTLYKEFIDRDETEFIVPCDLSNQLPFGPCNASVQVEKLDDEYRVHLLVRDDMCWELDFGNVKRGSKSKYELITVLEKDGLKLKELNEDTLLEIILPSDSESRSAISTYKYHLKFDKFVDKKEFNLEPLTETHPDSEISELNLY